MLITIPSRGRAQTLVSGTLSLIPPNLWPWTAVFTHPSELDEYREAVNFAGFDGVGVWDVEYDTIGEKRLRIGECAKNGGHHKFVMLDDDIDFLVRKASDDWRLTAASEHDVGRMFRALDSYLDDYAQVAISPREGNNRFGVGGPTDLVAECTRAMRITAYNVDDFLSVEHNRVRVMEDFDVLLQLLKSGRKNAVLGWWANGQKMTNAAGGCSIWRTREIHDEAVEKLASLHPEHVKVRLKQNKTDAEGLGTRKEVTVQWKRAYASSQH